MATEACLGLSEPTACAGRVPGVKFQPIRECQVFLVLAFPALERRLPFSSTVRELSWRFRWQ